MDTSTKIKVIPLNDDEPKIPYEEWVKLPLKTYGGEKIPPLAEEEK